MTEERPVGSKFDKEFELEYANVLTLDAMPIGSLSRYLPIAGSKFLNAL